MVFAIYMYGNGSIFPVTTSDDETTEEAVEDASEVFNFSAKLNVQVGAMQAAKISTQRKLRGFFLSEKK